MSKSNPAARTPPADDQYSLEARHAREAAWARARGLVFVRSDRPERILGRRKWVHIERWMDHPYLWRPAKPAISISRGVRYRPTLFTCAPYYLDENEREEIPRFCADNGFAFKIYEVHRAEAVEASGDGVGVIEIWRANTGGGAA